MAQAQYDEFVRLRKTGTDALTARKQAYGETPVAPIANAPVAGQAPVVAQTPAPVATPTQSSLPEGTTSNDLRKAVNKMGGNLQQRIYNRNSLLDGGVIQEQTSTPTTGTTTPSGATLNSDGSVTPAPVETSAAPVTPAPTPTTPVETPAPIDKNAEIKAKNEAQMALNKQKSELAIADRKRQAEESKLASIPTDQKGVLNALISGASVPTQNTQAYRNAKVQYDTYKKFNSMTPTQLLDNLKMNEIGTDMDQLLASNPNYVQAKQKLNEIQKVTNLNKTMSNIVAGANGTEIKAVTPEQNEIDISTKLMQKFGLDDANAEAFSQFIATDEEMADNKAKLLANRNQLSNVNRQINETTTLLNQGIKDIKAQYPDMSASGIITLMGSRLSEFNDTITNLNSTKSLLDADIKMEMDLAKSAFDAKSADIQAQNQIRSAMAIGDYNASLDLQKNQAEFEQKIAQQAQAMNDPVMAISSMIDEYKKLGIPFTRSTQQVIADFQSSGQDLPTYLSGLQKLIQEKPEYQAYKDKQSGTEWQSTSITRYNPSTGANESTPIFYRKKTSGGFEAVDLSGNPIDVSNLGGTGTPGTPGTLPTSFTGDTSSYIASKEGFRDKAYQDSTGVWTIGYGTTKINGKPVQPGQTITQEDAQKQLASDIDKHSTWKTLIDPNTLSPSQQTALASFEYNLGPGIWNQSAMNIIDMIKSGDLSGAGKEMLKYNQAGGKVIKGLQNRRAEESQLLQSTGTSNTTTQTYSPDKIKSFEAFNGTSFPSDYKTPDQQKQYRKEYNSWIASRPGTKIETGNDLINIKLDKPTEGQSASMAFGARMIDAAKNVQQYEDIFNKLPLAEQIYQSKAPELITSQNQKSLMREKMEFITAVLRKESGAAISPSEFAGQDKIFFPQPGDGPDVLLAKRNARNFRVKAMLATAGTDTEGNSVSKYYNPPIITTEDTAIPAKTDKITTLKKNYFN